MDGLFDYGAYATFIWVCYGVSALALGGLTALTLRAYGKAKARAKALGVGDPS